MWDAIVAGTGPAGAVAALVLARHGHRVLLADKIEPSAFKVGEALPGAAARLLRALDLPPLELDSHHCSIGGNFTSWNSETLIATDFINDPDGPGWRLNRVHFDGALRGQPSVPAPNTARPLCAVCIEMKPIGLSGSTTAARSRRDGSWMPPAAAADSRAASASDA